MYVDFWEQSQYSDGVTVIRDKHKSLLQNILRSNYKNLKIIILYYPRDFQKNLDKSFKEKKIENVKIYI